MTAQSAGHEPMSTSGWQLTPRCYNTSYRVAAFRALIIALILAAGLAFLILPPQTSRALTRPPSREWPGYIRHTGHTHPGTSRAAPRSSRSE